MKILKFKLLKDFARKHPGAADPLMRWAEFVELMPNMIRLRTLKIYNYDY